MTAAVYYTYPNPSGGPTSLFSPKIYYYNSTDSISSGLITNHNGEILGSGANGAVGTRVVGSLLDSGLSYIDEIYPGNTTDYIRFHSMRYNRIGLDGIQIDYAFPPPTLASNKVFLVSGVEYRIKYRNVDNHSYNFYFQGSLYGLSNQNTYPNANLSQFTSNYYIPQTNGAWRLFVQDQRIGSDSIKFYFDTSYIRIDTNFEPYGQDKSTDWVCPTLDISYIEVKFLGTYEDGIFNSDNVALYIRGRDNYSGELDLSVLGGWPSGIVDLSMSGVWPNNTIDLYTRGKDTYSGELDLSLPWATSPGIYGVLDQANLFTKYGYAVLRPDGTYENNGWSGLPDNTNLYNNIDEPYANDNDYIQYQALWSSSLPRNIKFSLSDISGTIDKNEDHIIKLRTKYSNSSDTVTLGYRLYEGSSTPTPIVDREILLTDSYQDESYSLTTSEKNQINDYNDLYLEFEPIPYLEVGGSDDVTISWTELVIGNAATGGVNNSVDLYTSAADTINSDPTGLPLIISGIPKYTDSLDLMLKGGGKAAGLNLYLAGENYKSFTNNVDLYLQNDFEIDPSGTTPLYTVGSYKDNASLNMVIKGPELDGVNTYINLYTGGYSWQSYSGTQDLSISGEYFSSLPSGLWYDSLSMVMPGSFKYNTYMNLYTRGLGPQDEGDLENSPTLNLSLMNFLESSGELDLNILGGGYSAGMNVYLKTHDGLPYNSGIDLTVWGTTNSGLFGTFDIYMNGSNAPSGVMNLYTAGTPQTFTSNSNMNVFLKGIGNLDGSITKTADLDFTLYNAWQTAEQSGLDMMVLTRSGTEGAVPVSGNMNLYLARTEGISHQFPLVMIGPDSTTDMVDLYLNATPNYRDNVSLYISGVEVKNDLMRLYINGT